MTRWWLLKFPQHTKCELQHSRSEILLVCSLFETNCSSSIQKHDKGQKTEIEIPLSVWNASRLRPCLNGALEWRKAKKQRKIFYFPSKKCLFVFGIDPFVKSHWQQNNLKMLKLKPGGCNSGRGDLKQVRQVGGPHIPHGCQIKAFYAACVAWSFTAVLK